jgi:hypothetical protein
MASEEDLAKDVTKAENKAIDELNDHFRASVRKTISETNWDDIERRLQAQQQAEDVADSVSWQGYDPTGPIEETFLASSEVCAANIADLVAKGGSFSFTLTDPNALKWLDEFGANEIQYISDSQRAAIKQIVANGYRDGVTYQQQAREIKQLIGLNPRRAEAVQNMRAKLLERGKLSDEKIDRQAARYAEKLLRQRAGNIAVQEATTAGAQAFYETTKDAVQRGILDPQKYEGYRIVTGDDRLCPECAARAGESRLLPDGVYQSSGGYTPKLHHLCRCVEGIREIGMKKKQSSVIKKASGMGQMKVIFDCQALKRKDGILYIPTVPLIECVYEQWGQRILRSYAEFSQSSNWLHGIPIVVNHEELTPDARRIGQLFDIQNNPEGFKSTAISRFYEIDCTQRELEALLSGKPHDGSLRWSCYLVQEAGEWTDPITGERKQYDYKEVGPYCFVEYSFVKGGVISTDDGAGFNMQSKSLQEGEEDMDQSDVMRIVEEAQRPLIDRVGTLERKQKDIEDSAVARQEAKQKEHFQNKLKPAYLEQIDTLWAECKQTGYLAFEARHPEAIIQERQSKGLSGSPLGGGGHEFNLAAEQAKIDYRRKL